MGIHAVAQGHLRGVGGILFAEVVGDGQVVLAGVCEGLQGEGLSGLLCGVFVGGGFDLVDYFVVVVGVAYYGHPGVVLGGGTQKCDAPDVDVFDRICYCYFWFGYCFDEWVQVTHHHSD